MSVSVLISLEVSVGTVVTLLPWWVHAGIFCTVGTNCHICQNIMEAVYVKIDK